MSVRTSRIGWRYRANITSRTLAGTIGAYGVASLFAFATARLWPADRLDATIPATLLAFLIMPVGTLWAFLASGPMRAWGGLLGAAALLGGAAWWAGPPVA